VILREINGPNKTAVQIYISVAATVVELQYAIENETTIPPRFQRLYFGNQRCDVAFTNNLTATLSDVGICNSTEVVVLENELYDSYLQVELIEVCGKTTMMDLRTNTTIKQLQTAVYDKTGIPPLDQRLQFCAKRIDAGGVGTSTATLRDMGLTQQLKRVVMLGGLLGGSNCAGCGGDTHRSSNRLCPNYTAMQGDLICFIFIHCKEAN
jgi:Ubiquitin-like domain